MDFTITTYKKLLNVLVKAGYAFQTFSEFLEKPEKRVILLRHDVDAKKLNSLHFAGIQHSLGIRGTYYFRMVPQSFDEVVIRKIAGMGHEIGYHYEDMDLVSSKFQVRGSKLREEDLFDAALKSFQENLAILRKICPVKTICMHGSPLSRFDNKAVWKKYNYRDFGIIGEPYFDIDFREVFYLTDTGRRWDGDKVSIRDKVDGSKFKVPGSKFQTSLKQQISFDQQPTTTNQILKFHSTKEIIEVAESNNLPDKIMFTFHPQRWTDKPIAWINELILQNMKNQIKKYYIKQT